MDIKNFKTLDELITNCENIWNQDSGFKTSFTIEDPGFPNARLKISEYTEKPILSIFNRIVLNNTYDYFSCSFEAVERRTSKELKHRAGFKKRWYKSSFTLLQDEDLHFNNNLNYDSSFYNIENKVQFYSDWLPTIFSLDILNKFLNGQTIENVFSNYIQKFSDTSIDIWKHSSDILRITEERKDFRIIIVFNPYDLHPELSLTSLENVGLATSFIALIYDWFSYRKLLSLVKKVNLSFDNDNRYKSIPNVFNNEQIFTIEASPFLIDGLELVKMVRKGTRRQRQFYRKYFNDLLDFYPTDVFGKSDFIDEEVVDLSLPDAEEKYYQGRRVYFKPEFNLVFALYAKISSDDGGVEYPEFYMHMHYQPQINQPEPIIAWREHFILDDLGK